MVFFGIMPVQIVRILVRIMRMMKPLARSINQKIEFKILAYFVSCPGQSCFSQCPGQVLVDQVAPEWGG